jgi:UDP-glucose 4-epimerase
MGEDHALETHLIPLIFKTALGQRARLTIYGDDYPTKDGSCVRDYIHVLDLADAHVKALRYLLGGGESRTLNLGSQAGASVLEVIRAAERIAGAEIPYEIAGRRPGDPAILVASAEKARAVLGWRPVRSVLETILKDAWRWHSAHPMGYKGREGDGA